MIKKTAKKVSKNFSKIRPLCRTTAIRLKTKLNNALGDGDSRRNRMRKILSIAIPLGMVTIVCTYPPSRRLLLYLYRRFKSMWASPQTSDSSSLVEIESTPKFSTSHPIAHKIMMYALTGVFFGVYIYLGKTHEVVGVEVTTPEPPFNLFSTDYVRDTSKDAPDYVLLIAIVDFIGMMFGVKHAAFLIFESPRIALIPDTLKHFVPIHLVRTVSSELRAAQY